MGIKTTDVLRSKLELEVRRQNLNPYQRNTLDRVASGRDHWVHCGTTSWEGYFGKMLLAARRPELVDIVLGESAGDALIAFINDNRWMVRCECGGYDASPDPECPKSFCLKCFNALNGHKPRSVTFPKERGAIEGALCTSPYPLWRNWLPDQSVESLRS